MKKKIALLLTLALILTGTFHVSGNISSHADETSTSSMILDDKALIETLSPLELEYFLKAKAQTNAILAYNEMMSAFASIFGEKDGFPARYPDSYAGAYLNDDAQLVIQINKSSFETAIEMKEYAQYINIKQLKSENKDFNLDTLDHLITFENAAFSLNALTEMFELITPEVIKDYETVAYGIDTLNNVIFFEMEYPEYIKATDQIDSYKGKLAKHTHQDRNDGIPLIFKIGVKSETAMHHIGGQGAYNFQSITGVRGGSATLGFTGKVNGTPHYITAGHSTPSGFNANQIVVIFGSAPNPHGAISQYRYHNNQAGDWALVTLNQGETTSNTIFINSSGGQVPITGRVNQVPVNTIVNSYGNTSRVWSSHTVTLTNQTVHFGASNFHPATTVTGMTRARINSGSVWPGDSGGPVVIPSWSAVGTIAGYSNSQPTDIHISPMTHIPSNFSVN
jgi:hypothetical protein